MEYKKPQGKKLERRNAGFIYVLRLLKDFFFPPSKKTQNESQNQSLSTTFLLAFLPPNDPNRVDHTFHKTYLCFP